ncbi:MAG: DUF3275 family protein [Desulfovibrionaceae bacterium]|jgi:hypothetical protein|nr:DUF3275 family protein [Desulfovibrionaceae bacterium]
MITAENAVLRVKRIRQSRNGAFSVGELCTDFGEFKVKDPLLEQFDEGVYDVTAWIYEIGLAQYVAYGKGVTEIRARLHDIQVHAEDRRPAPDEPSEMDPLDEPEQIRLPKAPSKPTQQAAGDGGDKRWDKFKKKPGKARIDDSKPEMATQPEQASPFDEETLKAIERREPIQVDMSQDRAVLRSLIAGLKERGYRFDSLSEQKLWIPVD